VRVIKFDRFPVVPPSIPHTFYLPLGQAPLVGISGVCDRETAFAGAVNEVSDRREVVLELIIGFEEGHQLRRGPITVLARGWGERETKRKEEEKGGREV